MKKGNEKHICVLVYCVIEMDIKKARDGAEHGARRLAALALLGRRNP
jgi:hypothetical protein